MQSYKLAIKQSVDSGHDESVSNILKMLLSEIKDPWTKLKDIKGIIEFMIEENETYKPEPNDLRRVNLLVRQFVDD